MRASLFSQVAGGLAAILAGAVLGRGAPGVDGSRLEASLGSTFANLVRVERARLGLPPVDAASLGAIARCHRTGAATERRGAGEWTCTIAWLLPGRRQSMRDAYELVVTPDGCYTASSEGEAGHLGGPTLVTQDGTPVANLLYAFDGCFDATSAEPPPSGAAATPRR